MIDESICKLADDRFENLDAFRSKPSRAFPEEMAATIRFLRFSPDLRLRPFRDP